MALRRLLIFVFVVVVVECRCFLWATAPARLCAARAVGADGFQKREEDGDGAAVFEDEAELTAAVCEVCHAAHDVLHQRQALFADVCSLADFSGGSALLDGGAYFFPEDKMSAACQRFSRDAENILLVVSKFLAASRRPAPASVDEMVVERGVDGSRLVLCKPLCSRVKHERFVATYDERWGVVMRAIAAAAEAKDEAKGDDEL